jgi:hypothetical protein
MRISLAEAPGPFVFHPPRRASLFFAASEDFLIFILNSSFFLSWFVSDSAANDDTRDAIIARLANAAWDRANSLGR